jgi:hypothetical protein
MLLVDHAYEVGEKGKNRFLALAKVHARRGELFY